MMSNKIGVGVITCNRLDFFKQCISSIEAVDALVVVNDGAPYPEENYPTSVEHVIQHEKNMCVGISKNDALRYLLNKGCEHIFLVEDDIEIIDNEVFRKYIKASEITGLKHLNYALHGPLNKDDLGFKKPRFVVNYDNDISISLNWSCPGAFSYYNKKVIETVGFMDERFQNYWEHLEHSYRMVLQGLLPGFRWWPDIEDSDKYIWDLDQDLSQSEIRKDKSEFKKKYSHSTEVFFDLHGTIPREIEQKPLGKILENLNKIKELYAITNG
ncbi:MAG: hypothetical protein AAGG81_07145 [Chlamydiota bacterium]